MPKENLPVYKFIGGKLVRKDGDVRDTTSRYATVVGPDGAFLREFTAEEERLRDEQEARWEAESPQRKLEAQREKSEIEAFRDSVKYERRLVAFIDILGWKEAVKNSITQPEKTQRLGLALNHMRNNRRLAQWKQDNGGPDGWPGDEQVTFFSDCIAISTTADLPGKSQLITSLGFLSACFLSHGFLLRGGVTVGDLYHRDSILFGPGFLKAYELESLRAIYPRIILDPELANIWGQGDLYKDGREIGYAKTWRLSNDGFRFFDFLQPLGGVPDVVNSPSLMENSLLLLRPLVMENLGIHKSNARVRSKYVWLANYFNDVCRETSGHGVDPISEEKLQP